MQASNTIQDTDVSNVVGREATEDTFFSYNVEFYIAKPELEEYPETVLPNPAVVSLTVPAQKLECNCVLYLGNKYGHKSIRGYDQARDIKTNSEVYPVGYVVTYEGPYGHVALYTDTPEGILVIDEANFENCKVTSGRIVPPGVIKGYLSFQ